MENATISSEYVWGSFKSPPIGGKIGDTSVEADTKIYDSVDDKSPRTAALLNPSHEEPYDSDSQPDLPNVPSEALLKANSINQETDIQHQDFSECTITATSEHSSSEDNTVDSTSLPSETPLGRVHDSA